MKKRTKKKIWKFTKKILLGMGKIVFVYPLKFLIKSVKKSYSKSKKTIKKSKRKDLQAHYEELKEVKCKTGHLDKFIKKIYSNKSTIGIILGARGTGKSAIGMRLLENFKFKTKKKIYALGFKEESLPRWIDVIKNIEEIHNDAVILIDEGGIEFSSRKAMSNANKLLSEILLIARHKDLSVAFISQSSANLDINALRQADYLILKPSSLLQKDFERKKIKQVYEQVNDEFEKLNDVLGITYLYADNYRGFVTNTLPSFWNEKVSKSYSGK